MALAAAIGTALGRTLTGAWIETRLEWVPLEGRRVAPSRVRGLKRLYSYDTVIALVVAPSRVRGLKLSMI